MFILEYKLRGKPHQYQAIDEAIRTVQLVRNKCLRHWQDNKGVGQKDLYKYVTQLRNEYTFVKDLNSTACQQACERTWTTILKFFNNCKNIEDRDTMFRRSCSYPENNPISQEKHEHQQNRHQRTIDYSS